MQDKPCKPVHGLFYLTKLFLEKHRIYHEHFEEVLEQNLKVRNYIPRSAIDPKSRPCIKGTRIAS